MKALYPILLALVLAACATPYQQVYTSGEGDYYISETASAGYYGGSNTLGYIGMYPWWSGSYLYGYPGPMYTYYSPYFYPHHFVVWGPVPRSYHYFESSMRTPAYWRRTYSVAPSTAESEGENPSGPSQPPNPPIAISRYARPDLWGTHAALEYQRQRMVQDGYDAGVSSAAPSRARAAVFRHEAISRSAASSRTSFSRTISTTSGSRSLSVSTSSPKSVASPSASRSSTSRSTAIKKD